MAVQNMSHNNDKRQVFSGFGLKGTDSDFERKSSNFGLILGPSHRSDQNHWMNKRSP